MQWSKLKASEVDNLGILSMSVDDGDIVGAEVGGQSHG